MSCDDVCVTIYLPSRPYHILSERFWVDTAVIVYLFLLSLLLAIIIIIIIAMLSEC